MVNRGPARLEWAGVDPVRVHPRPSSFRGRPVPLDAWGLLHLGVMFGSVVFVVSFFVVVFGPAGCPRRSPKGWCSLRVASRWSFLVCVSYRAPFVGVSG